MPLNVLGSAHTLVSLALRILLLFRCWIADINGCTTSTISISTPIDFEGTSIADLSASVLDEEFAPLIFGRPVKIRRGRLNYDGSTVGQGKILDRVIPISPRNCSPEKERDKRFQFGR